MQFITVVMNLIKSLTQFNTEPVILNPVTAELSPDAPYEPAPESLMDAIERLLSLLLLC